MRDVIFESFLEQQYLEASALASASEILDLWPQSPQRYLAHFNCNGLVRGDGHQIRPSPGPFTVGLYLPPGYLRSLEPITIVTWLHPPNVWHPNIAPPVVCLGRIPPGTPLVDLLHQVYEIVTWQRFTPNEFDALNKAACQWARNHMELFPVDRRPLKWRASGSEKDTLVGRISIRSRHALAPKADAG